MITAPKIFSILTMQIFLYFCIGMLLPFLASFLGKEECSSVSPSYVYMAYAIFAFLSTAVEIGVLVILRKAMTFDGQSMLPFNRYLFAKWLNGQFANFVYFMHFCYVASALMCLTESGGVDAALTSAEASEDDPLKKGQMIMKVISSILSIIAAPILLISNVRRVYFTGKNFKKHPDVHRLMPNMQRNMQLAWLLNFQATAVALESTSLSDYIYENGGPVLAGKAKDRPKDFVYKEMKTINSQILSDKMKF